MSKLQLKVYIYILKLVNKKLYLTYFSLIFSAYDIILIFL